MTKICPKCMTKSLHKIPFKIGYRCKKCLIYVEYPLDEWEID
jgi:ribosomal protein L37AE/L43A